MTKTKRLRACGCWPTSSEGVDVYKSDLGAYYVGMQSCGSPWICPVCAAKIRQRHADQIAAAALSWLADGCSLYSMMFTLPHSRGMPLAELWDFMRGAFRKLLTGRFWQGVKADFNLGGFVRSTEATHGENGWHPHIHVLLFVDGDLDSGARARLQTAIFDRWKSFVEGAGYDTPKKSLFRLDPVRSASAVCDYLVKTGHFETNPDFAVIAGEKRTRRVGLELARSDLKDGRRRGRTPFQIITDYAADPVENTSDLALWYEWEDESKGKRSVEWSRDTIRRADGSYTFESFRKRFGFDDVDDEQLVEDDVGGAKLYHLSPAALSVLRVAGRLLRVLEIAESHGAGGVDFYTSYLMSEFVRTGDLTGLDALDEMISRSELVPRDVGG